MSAWKNIVGTFADWFGFGGDEDVAIGKDGSGNLVFKDEVVSGTKTLTQLLEGAQFQFTPDLVPTGETWTVPETKQYIVHRDVTIDGDLVLDGELVTF